MTKKIIALSTLGCFIVFSYSCAVYTLKKTPLDSLDVKKREGEKISRAQTKTGEQVEFSETPATRIRGDFIVGEKLAGQVKIEKKDIANIRPDPNDNKSYLSERESTKLITTKSGVIYRAISIRENNDFIIFDAYLPTSLPLSEVTSVWLEKLDVARIIRNVLIITIVAGTVALLVLLKAAAPSWGLGAW